MINRIISFSINNKFIIGLFILALVGWGTYSLSRLPIDAIPDITNNQVQVISLAPSLAVQEVESFITAPIEVAVANIPDIIELRSISTGQDNSLVSALKKLKNPFLKVWLRFPLPLFPQDWVRYINIVFLWRKVTKRSLIPWN